MTIFVKSLVVLCIVNFNNYANAFILIPKDSPYMSIEFSNLGDAYLHNNLIWSNQASWLFDFSSAQKFCSNIGARLPTINEWKQLFAEPVPENILHFNASFWSSTVSPDFLQIVEIFRDYGNPYASKSHIKVSNAVRCVRELSLEELEVIAKEKDSEINNLKEKLALMKNTIEILQKENIERQTLIEKYEKKYYFESLFE